MSKESIIRILKENEKLIVVSVVILISGIIIGVGISAMIKPDSTLYQRSRDGIYIEEEYLIYNDTISIRIYAKEGDIIHAHWRTWDSSFHIERTYRDRFGAWGTWDWQTEGYDEFISDESGVITVEFKNTDHNEHLWDTYVVDGFIEIFVIVWNEYDFHYCPLCQ